MLDKIRSHTNIISLVLMIFLTCVTQVFILLKSSLVAGLFGTSAGMDAYNLVNSITTFIFGILAAGIPTIIIPCYVRKESVKVIDTFLTIIYGLILIMSVLISIFRVQLIGVLSNRGELFTNMTCNILIVLLFAQFLLSITGVTDAYYQCSNRYNIPKIINLISQALVVGFLICLKGISIYQYTLIIAGGLVFTFVLNIFFAIKNGWKYRIAFDIKNPKAKELMRVFLPMIFSSGVYKLTLLADSLIASRLDEGLLTVLSYSNQIAVMIDTVLIGNLLIYAYPKIVKNIQEDSDQCFFWNQTVLFHNVVLLVVSVFFAIGNEGINLLFRHGSFSAEAAYLVFCGSLLYIIGQQNSTIINLIYRYFYSVGDTKSTAQNSVIVSILNIMISITLVKIIGFYGIILGTVISSAISMVLIILKFEQKIGLGKSFRSALVGFGKNLIVVLLTIGVIFFTKSYFVIPNRVISILVFGSETLLLHISLTLLFNREIISFLKKI